jgi:hypothetical protein
MVDSPLRGQRESTADRLETWEGGSGVSCNTHSWPGNSIMIPHRRRILRLADRGIFRRQPSLPGNFRAGIKGEDRDVSRFKPAVWGLKLDCFLRLALPCLDKWY